MFSINQYKWRFDCWKVRRREEDKLCEGLAYLPPRRRWEQAEERGRDTTTCPSFVAMTGPSVSPYNIIWDCHRKGIVEYPVATHPQCCRTDYFRRPATMMLLTRISRLLFRKVLQIRKSHDNCQIKIVINFIFSFKPLASFKFSVLLVDHSCGS